MEIETYEGCFTIIKRSVKVKLASKILIEETLSFNSTFGVEARPNTRVLWSRKNLKVKYLRFQACLDFFTNCFV